MSEINVAEQARNRLKKVLFNQGRYITNSQYQTYVTLEENSIHVVKLVQKLEELGKVEQEYATTRAQQNWATYIKNTAFISPEYQAYQQKKQLLEAAIQNIEEEYIRFTKEENAKEIADRLKTIAYINPQFIEEQIEHMETMISRYYSGGSNKYYCNLPSNQILEPDGQTAHESEITLIKKYIVPINVSEMLRNMLPSADDDKQQESFNNLIKDFSDNASIQRLFNNYANLHAKRIFCEINQALYSNFGSIDLANTNINFFKTELNKAIAEQDLFLTKINLLYQQVIQDKYIIKHDIVNQHLDQITKDIDMLTPQQIYSFANKAKEKFEKNKNYQLLNSEQQHKFIDNLTFIEYQTFLNETKGIEATLMEQKIKSVDEEIKQQIQATIKQQANSPEPLSIISPQPNVVQQITGWSTEPVVSQSTPKSQSQTTYKFYDEATEIYNKIAGTDKLSPEQKIVFIKNIAIILGELQEEQDQRWRSTKAWNLITNLVFSSSGLPESIKDKIKEIQTEIHKTFAQTAKLATKITRFKEEIYQTTEINDPKLRTALEKDLTDALINFKKNKFNISPIPPFDPEESKKDPNVALKNRLDNSINRIETAKILTKIDSFNNIPLEQQSKYLDEVNKHLLEISILNNKKAKLQDDWKLNIKQNVQGDIIKNNQNIEKEQQAIKDIIININLYSKQFTQLRNEFSITDDSTNLLESIKNILATETVQNAISGAAIVATGAVAAPILGGLASNIPVIGSYIPSLTTGLSLSNIAASGLIGGILGIKIPFRKIFKPITYVFEEMKDIVKNPNHNSLLDRAVRGASIVLPVLGAVVGAGFALAAVANPFSGPVIAGIALGAVATFAVSSLCGWGVSKVCKTIREAHLYDETQAYDFCCGNNNNKSRQDIEMDARRLSIFFKERIEEYNKKLANLKTTSMANELEKVHIEKIISMLKQAWKNITENKDPEWDNLLKVLYYDKKYSSQKDLSSQVKVADDVTNQLLELIDTPKCVKSRELDSEHLEKIKQKQKAIISFEDTAKQLNNFITQPNQELQKLYEISSIIKHRNSK